MPDFGEISIPRRDSNGNEVPGETDTVRLYAEDVQRTYLSTYVNETDVSDLRGVEPFASHDDFLAAINSPEYRRSAAYRQHVAKRITVTELK